MMGRKVKSRHAELERRYAFGKMGILRELEPTWVGIPDERVRCPPSLPECVAPFIGA